MLSPVADSTPPIPPAGPPKFIKKSTENKVQQKSAKLQAQRRQDEYSGALGPPNGSKMEPKMEPKILQKGSLHKKHEKLFFCSYLQYFRHVANLPKQLFFDAYFWCFSVLVSKLPKKSQKNVSRPPMWTFWCPNALQSYPREAPKGNKIHQKSTRNRLQAAVATHRRLLSSESGPPEGGTPSKKHPKSLKKSTHHTRLTTRNTS